MTDVVDRSAGFLESVHQLLGCILHWSDRDPFSVSMMLLNTYEDYTEPAITWEFSRELMYDAYCRPDHVVGLGDVLMSYDPREGDLRIWLTDVYDERHAVLLDATRIYHFLIRTMAITPLGQEQTSQLIDEALSQLLGGQ